MLYNKKINGLLLLNKPKGITSNNILQKIKYITKSYKTGFIGTLDPLATGILLICFGKTTKLSKFIINEKKTYKVTFILGYTTNTYDSYGFITKKYKIKTNKYNIYDVINNYKGKIKQKIPTYSACKYKGKPLYKYAIKGIKIKKYKYIYIYKIKIIKINKNIIKLKIKCSKGTYIRSIIHDIGKILNTGAYIISLKRTKIGKFKIKHSYTIQKIKQNIKNNKNIILDHNIIKYNYIINNNF